jgi:hypothetical protein
MIIVSQDKDGIINFENITAIRLIVNLEDNKRNMIAIDTVNAERYTVAKYVTEERAKEVLAEITEFWKNGAMSDYKGFICYEMPED